jgi:hypothetical protein
MTQGIIHTVGDSTLDNLFWMLGDSRQNLKEAKARTVEGHLQRLCTNDDGAPRFRVVSHAFDGFTTKSLLDGDRIGRVFPYMDNNSVYLREKVVENNRNVQPLELLKTEIQKNADKIHHIVLSVGGNDYRENLGNPIRLLRDIPKIQRRYLKILDKIQEFKKLENRPEIRPILMLQYRTDATSDGYHIYTIMKAIGIVATTVHVVGIVFLTAPIFVLMGKISLLAGSVLFLTGITAIFLSRKVVNLSLIKDTLIGRKSMSMGVLGNLLQLFYRPILERAKKDNIPVLDLSNTFDPYDHSLYNATIEPSRLGGEIIAKGICEIVKREHARTEEVSKLYSTMLENPQDESMTFQSTINDPANWQVHYPKKP